MELYYSKQVTNSTSVMSHLFDEYEVSCSVHVVLHPSPHVVPYQLQPRPYKGGAPSEPVGGLIPSVAPFQQSTQW